MTDEARAVPGSGTAAAARRPSAEAWAWRRRWAAITLDLVGPRASVQPLAGWLLAGLLGLVVYLTIVYAPGAFARAQQPPGADPGGVITLAAGYWTIALVSVVALMVAFEPQFRRMAGDRRLAERRRGVLRTLGEIAWAAPGVLLSAIDTVLARAIAALVGATQKGAAVRYVWGAAVVLAAMGTALLAPPRYGLPAAVAGIVAVIAVVRRWSWIESDRDTFLVERGMRADAQRIGFSEDLRDEALVGIVCLFALIPLLLRQVQFASCAAGACAFVLDSGAALPEQPFAQFLAWLGYFGAELAKSVPFVDWSEVFQVANQSPIEPHTALGAQVVFAMRATLDLLLLAAVVQAVGIASRLTDQDNAFRNNRLPILEPFAEAREFLRAASAMEPALELRAIDDHAIMSFPRYDEPRLRELITTSREIRREVREAAVALLGSQNRDLATSVFLFSCASSERDAALARLMLMVASDIPAERRPEDRDADRARLIALLKDAATPASARAAAARRLGRIGGDATDVLMERLSDRREDLKVRADAAVALAKLAPADAAARARAAELAAGFGDSRAEDELPVMATAHALARFHADAPEAEILKHFAAIHEPYARYGAQIQAAPMSVEAAKASEIGVTTEHMVRITPGKHEFPARFRIGADANTPGVRPDQTPRVDIQMERAYAIGRFPVTNREFRRFDKSRQRSAGADDDDFPVVEVSWSQAMGYAEWLEWITGERYRLPSEAEWEYACRAGTDTAYWWGDAWESARAPTQLRKVNVSEPNPWGLRDLYGHVYEWCADPWHAGHEGRPATAEPWLADGSSEQRVVRGGSWSYPNAEQREKGRLRSSYRNCHVSTHVATNFGFRLARSLYD